MNRGRNRIFHRIKNLRYLSAADYLRFYQIHRHPILRVTFECATCPLLLHTAPLLEEKWDLDSQALIPNIHEPLLHDQSRAGAGSPSTTKYGRTEFCEELEYQIGWF